MKKHFKWSNSCGDCSHYLMYHIETQEGNEFPDTFYTIEGVPLWVIQRYGHDCRKCLCAKWVPKDNLDRVEYLVEEKGLI